MKINRTFSIDYDLAIDLRKKQNQSEEVCKALRKHLRNEEEILTITEATDLELITELRLRFGLIDGKSELLKTIQAML